MGWLKETQMKKHQQQGQSDITDSRSIYGKCPSPALGTTSEDKKNKKLP